MSLSTDDIALIKQLFQAQDNRLDARFEKIDQRFEKLEATMNERFELVDEKIDTILDAIGTEFNEQSDRVQSVETTVKQHDKRIRRLESAAA